MVSATGLRMKVMNGITLEVDGRRCSLQEPSASAAQRSPACPISCRFSFQGAAGSCYRADIVALRWRRLDDGVLKFVG